jgi:hypothetical protein
MRAKSRRKIEMGQRVLEFIKQHPNLGPGFATATARLQERLARARQLAQQQLDGRSEVAAATARKADLKRLMLSAHLDHLSSVAQVAAAEDPELIQKFNFPPDARTYLSFRAAASGMAAEAESRKELLLRHGLSEDVLNGLITSLEQFETVVEQGSAGRLTQISATAELMTVADEVVQLVKVMNGLIRLKFGNQPSVLAAWESASNVFATPTPEEQPESGTTTPPATSGEVRPAA